MNIRTLVATVTLMFAAAAQAATPIIDDNFNGDIQGFDRTPDGWGLMGTGDVDVIGTNFFDLIPGNGNYVDLVGSNGFAGTLYQNTSLLDRGVYEATFQLGGNHRDGVTDHVTVVFGPGGNQSSRETFSIGPNDPFTTCTMRVTLPFVKQLQLSFHDERDGVTGALLDNVTVSAVPEVGSLPMMLAGIIFIGFACSRRRI